MIIARRHQYLWSKQASDAWLVANEATLLARFAERVAFIERTGRQRTLVEICFATRSDAAGVAKTFGGRFERIPHARPIPDAKAIKIGKRLVVINVGGASAPRLGKNTQSRRKGPTHISQGPRQLIIPASGAFGTGDHATTAMCLRLIERVSRQWPTGWSMLDAGTGTGILALAAKCFGADHVIAIDNDPRAIAIARNNARLNRIRGIRFEIADATTPDTPEKVDLIAANLFSELLIDAIPKWRPRLKLKGILILSGILQRQEYEVTGALSRNKFAIDEIRRRGKWIAMVARN